MAGRAAQNEEENTRLKPEKFEFALIQKALDTADKNEAVATYEAGLISQFDGKKIEALASTPDKLPSFLGAASVIPVQLAKRALESLGMYKGPINDENDEVFRKAVMDFQKSRNLPAEYDSVGSTTSMRWCGTRARVAESGFAVPRSMPR